MQRLIILGAGYAGVQAVRKASRALAETEAVEIAIVDRNPYHQLVTEMYRVVGGEVDPEKLLLPVNRLVHGERVRIVTAQVVGLDLAGRQIRTDGPTLAYDVLIVALGSETEFFHVPGARRHAYTLQYVDSARRLRQRLRELSAGRSPPPLRIVTVGGGLTGIELVAEIAAFFRERFGASPPVQMTLVQAASTILPKEAETAQDLIAYAEKVLKGWSIAIETGTPVRAVHRNAVELTSGRILPSDLTVWTGGVRANGIPSAAGLPVDQRGRLKVGADLVVEGHPDLIAAGDVALARDPATGRPLPPTAQLAIQEGRVAGENASRRLLGQGDLQVFFPRPLGMAASLGHHLGIADFHPLHLKGRIALTAKKLALWSYLFTLESLAMGLPKSVSISPHRPKPRFP